ncbi:hypothetical protein [Segetibacter koreensis]|uniref:hypothetical protein n=1 Tax=Segetibacter koreensis TaxID=398037 RepID=UPI00036E1E92|nr:hypothetical protein [Segetibacter koreensis]
MSKNLIIVFSSVIISFAFVCCQKGIEQPQTVAIQSGITGNWGFISIEGRTSNAQEITEGSNVVKTVTMSEYISEKNAGTLRIDGTKMTTNNISYSINAFSKSSIYENGELTDTLSLPVQFAAPASSASTTYQMVGADSVYFETGSTFMSDITQMTEPSGAKIKLESDKLYLIQSATQSTTNTEDGATTTSTLQGTFIITFQRQ